MLAPIDVLVLVVGLLLSRPGDTVDRFTPDVMEGWQVDWLNWSLDWISYMVKSEVDTI